MKGLSQLIICLSSISYLQKKTILFINLLLEHFFSQKNQIHNGFMLSNFRKL